ncbi:MAG: hypothetical protein KDD62_14250 [Bdellovibrionales bacterium]|nr:hypothetical protein [Bdellovibrionales bacterium]
MTINMYIATVAWILLILGYTKRFDRKKHVPLVLSGIGLDIALVLYLQVTRSAVQTALEFELSILEQMHIWMSTLALLLYFPVLFLGFKLVKGNAPEGYLEKHKKLATTALILRSCGFILMFSMIK